jgi:hypothetical protein
MPSNADPPYLTDLLRFDHRWHSGDDGHQRHDEDEA